MVKRTWISATFILLAFLGQAGCEAEQGSADASDTSDAQCGQTSTTACDPDDLTKVFLVDACGVVVGVREECTADKLCSQSTPTSLATCKVAPTCTGALTGGTACAGNDSGALYSIDDCGDVVNVVAQTCDPGQVCETVDATTAQCVCDVSTDRVCDPSDPKSVFFLDTCGEIHSVQRTCPSSFVCGGDDPLAAECVAEVDPCPATLDKTCVEDDLSAIFYVDACGEPDGIFATCGTGEFCTIDPGNFTPQCRVPCWPTHTTIACSEDLRSTQWVNACGELTGEIVTTCAADQECDLNQCRSIPDPCYPPHSTTACDPSDVSNTWWMNNCGELTGEVAVDCAAQGLTCQNGQCVANCDQPIATACQNEAPWFLTGESTIRETDSCGRITATVVETCAAGEFCTTRPGVPTCINSMTDTTSPYYLKACSFGMFVDAQTNLTMDCRCRKDQSSDPSSLNGSILNCWTVESAWSPGNLRQGAGPHLYTIEPLVLGGLLSQPHGEVFAAMQYTDPNYTGGGLVVAYNYETGDRRIVSGIYADPAGGYVEYGSGYKSQRMVSGVPREETVHNYIFDLEMGNDGMLYTYGNGTLENVEIVRLNPTTGERSLVWRVEQKDGSVSPFGQCYGSRTIQTTASGKIPVQYEQRAFAMDPETGKFYLAFRNPSDGIGVVEISADGATCRIMSRTWAAELPDIGSGFSPQYTSLAGMHVRDGKVYVVHILQEALVAYDIATGNRAAVSVPGSIGTGDLAMGQNNIFWDPSRGLMWVMGSPAPFVGFAVDLASGDRDSVYRISPGGLLPGEYPVEQGHAGALRNGNYVGYGTVAIHPTNNDIVYLIGRKGEMYEYEISTGNSWIKSL